MSVRHDRGMAHISFATLLVLGSLVFMFAGMHRSMQNLYCTTGPTGVETAKMHNFRDASYSVCFYFKFYGTKIDTIENWTYLLDKIIKRGIPIYIWIETHDDVAAFNLPFFDQIKYVSHANKKIYNDSIEMLENQVDIFWENVGLIYQQPHCHAHLKSFFLTKEDYVVQIDGDDMFYDDLDLEGILDVILYMHQNNLDTMSRPYWILRGDWSFGFVIQNRRLLDQMYVLDVQNLPDTYKNDSLRRVVKSMEIVNYLNLDVYFGVLLMHYHKWGYRELFFHLNRHPFWNNSKNANQPFIDSKSTKIFCEKYRIRGFPRTANRQSPVLGPQR